MHNDPSPQLIGFNLAMMSASLAANVWAVRRWWLGMPLLPFSPRKPNDIGGLVTWAQHAGQAPDAELGATQPSFLVDVKIGLVAFLISFLPVIMLQAYLVQFIEYKHDLVEAIEKDPSPAMFLAVAFAAVVLAPLWEEFAFRNLLQGCLEALERISVAPHSRASGWLYGGMPILISSTAFAGMHWTQGPAAAPLFLFALVLGYLYYQTHRLLPSIVMHAALNSFSMMQLLI